MEEKNKVPDLNECVYRLNGTLMNVFLNSDKSNKMDDVLYQLDLLNNNIKDLGVHLNNIAKVINAMRLNK